MSERIPILNTDEMDLIPGVIELLSPSGYPTVESRQRPYNGQSHTDEGVRGQTEVKGITFRDLMDCYRRACYIASGLPREEWPASLFALPWVTMDPLAIAQTLSCEVERLMGIYPNIPQESDPEWMTGP